MTDAVEIRRLGTGEVHGHVEALAAVLHDCVAGGASAGYMKPFSLDDARAAFAGFADEAVHGRRLILAAFVRDELVGSVQVVLALAANLPHRGEIARMLVHRSARRRGVGNDVVEPAHRAWCIRGDGRRARTRLSCSLRLARRANRSVRRCG